MGNRNLEPFPRGILVADPSASTVYYSDPLEVGEARSLAVWFQVLASMPANVVKPAEARVETSNVLGFHGWLDLTPAGMSPDIGVVDAGVVEEPLRYVRVRVEVEAGEVPLLEFRMVAREG